MASAGTPNVNPVVPEPAAMSCMPRSISSVSTPERGGSPHPRKLVSLQLRSVHCSPSWQSLAPSHASLHRPPAQVRLEQSRSVEQGAALLDAESSNGKHAVRRTPSTTAGPHAELKVTVEKQLDAS